MGHRLRRSRIRARGRGLISHEADRLSDIGIKVNRCTVDDVRDSLFVHELVFMTAAGAGQATGNCLVSFWVWGLSKNWRNHQNASINRLPLMTHLQLTM